MTIASSAGTGLPPIPPSGTPVNTTDATAATATTTGGGAAPAKGCDDPSHVAGASGGGAADATAGAANALGGGDPMAGIAQALKGIVEALSKLMASLAGGAAGGGPVAKGGGGAETSTADFLATGAQPAAPGAAPTDVAGATGGGAPQKTHVGGEHGPGQAPHKPASQVGGQNGPGQKPGQVGGESGPGQAPQKFPLPGTSVGGQSGPGQKPGQVGGQNGPGQSPTQSPTQSPVQSPTQTSPTQGGGPVQGDVVQGGGPAQLGDVRLDEGMMNAVTLKSGAGNSVKMWGDPHIVLNVDGKQENFDIGYGPGGIELSDGTRVSWDTTENRKEVQNFRIDRPGTQGDVQVNADDTNVETGLQTYMTDDLLRELAEGLRQYKGNPMQPLTANAGT